MNRRKFDTTKLQLPQTRAKIILEFRNRFDAIQNYEDMEKMLRVNGSILRMLTRLLHRKSWGTKRRVRNRGSVKNHGTWSRREEK